MIKRLSFLTGAAVGYVLGARAGRGSYETIKSQADSLWHDPRVQEKVSAAGQTVKDKAPEVQAKLADVAGQAKDTAKNAAGQAKDAAEDAKDSTSGDSTDVPVGGDPDGDLQIGSESGSNYTPAETKFNSAE